MSKFNVTFTYDIDDDQADEWYGTRDPAEMAAIDQTNWTNSPIELGATIAEHDYQVTVTPAGPAE